MSPFAAYPIRHYSYTGSLGPTMFTVFDIIIWLVRLVYRTVLRTVHAT